MADYQLIIIGGGLSGIAAGIRAARFGNKTLILEQHSIPGGLNSYYYRQGHLLETGLHAMTNFAPVGDKRAPLNRLFRQLKLSRKQFVTHEQVCSEIRFPDQALLFSNEPELLEQEIIRAFPAAGDAFQNLKKKINEYDPFVAAPWRSTRAFLSKVLAQPLLEEMLLLPLMVYGNAEEYDMDLGQFVIMFRAVFEDGFFRPEGTIRDFLEILVNQYKDFDGELRYRCPVKQIVTTNDRVQGVLLESGEEISADAVLSTVGIPETVQLSKWDLPVAEYGGNMSFMETISLLPVAVKEKVVADRTIIFYNTQERFAYQRPVDLLDISWGVVCFPENFQGLSQEAFFQIRITNAANYTLWQQMEAGEYGQLKQEWALAAVAASGKIVGNYLQDIVYQDSFTPKTIERYTRKAGGAVYGSPIKIKDGCTPWANLFVAGTDQGYLGIVGAMLSGVTVVNQHLLR